MAKKTIPLSLRISDDDAAFLAGFTGGEATTPSEKVRHLLTEARERADAKEPEDGRAAAARVLLPGRTRWRKLEEEAGCASDLVRRLYDAAPDLFGILLVGPKERGDLPRFEEALAREAGRLLEGLLAAELGGHARAYKDGILEKELAPSKKLVSHMNDNDKGERHA